eukprot:m.172451 g.172451  ORF g.172451 m.172451 type:complete len:694 (+) comp31685_c8_seq3:611-2692(+)
MMEDVVGKIDFTVVHSGKHFDCCLYTNTTLDDFRTWIHEVTEVSPQNQSTLMFKGSNQDLIRENKTQISQKVHANTQPPTSTPVTLSMIGIRPNSKVVIVGTTDSDNATIRSEEQKAIRWHAAREKATKQRKLYSESSKVRVSPPSPYGFNNLRVLTADKLPRDAPPPSEALRLLERVRADRSVQAIVDKYQWTVGELTEFAPGLDTGMVGITNGCLLGFNKNKGQEISLRLRTDDFEGFRHYHIIIKTVLHELVHMVHSEHDSKFWNLNSQLNKEYDSLDWQKSSAHVLEQGGSGREALTFVTSQSSSSSSSSTARARRIRAFCSASVSRDFLRVDVVVVVVVGVAVVVRVVEAALVLLELEGLDRIPPVTIDVSGAARFVLSAFRCNAALRCSVMDVRSFEDLDDLDVDDEDADEVDDMRVGLAVFVRSSTTMAWARLACMICANVLMPVLALALEAGVSEGTFFVGRDSDGGFKAVFDAVETWVFRVSMMTGPFPPRAVIAVAVAGVVAVVGVAFLVPNRSCGFDDTSDFETTMVSCRSRFRGDESSVGCEESLRVVRVGIAGVGCATTRTLPLAMRDSSWRLGALGSTCTRARVAVASIAFFVRSCKAAASSSILRFLVCNETAAPLLVSLCPTVFASTRCLRNTSRLIDWFDSVALALALAGWVDRFCRSVVKLIDGAVLLARTCSCA